LASSEPHLYSQFDDTRASSFRIATGHALKLVLEGAISFFSPVPTLPNHAPYESSVRIASILAFAIAPTMQPDPVEI